MSNICTSEDRRLFSFISRCRVPSKYANKPVLGENFLNMLSGETTSDFKCFLKHEKNVFVKENQKIGSPESLRDVC